MKKITKVLGLLGLCLIGLSQESKAQGFTFSGGLEVALPLGDFGNLASFGVGASVGGEYALNDNMGITLNAGYIFLVPEEFFASAFMLPYQAGYKYYFDSNENGFYGHAQIGFHTVSATSEDISLFGTNIGGVTVSSTDLSYAIGVGYLINEKIDLGLRYNIVATEVSSSNYIGLRTAYNF